MNFTSKSPNYSSSMWLNRHKNPFYTYYFVCYHKTVNLATPKLNPRHDHVYAADDLYCAIVSRRKIQYQMVDFSVPDMEPVPQRNGYVYTVSSYTMIWKMTGATLYNKNGDKNTPS